MKKLMISIAFVALCAAGSQANAQHVKVNIALQPVWGPVGYDYVEYYYLPECDVYYYVPTGEFIYLSGSRWVFAPSLPGMYTCDLYSTYKVIINKPRPYLHHKVYVVEYAKYKTSPPRQVIIRDSDDPKYYVVKGNTHYNGPRTTGEGNTNTKEATNKKTLKTKKSNREETKKKKNGGR